LRTSRREAAVEAVGRLLWTIIDCSDPIALAEFWSQVFGLTHEEPFGDPPQYTGLLPTVPGGPALGFQRVPERKTVKNRLHLDVMVDDVEKATARIEELGGNRVPGPDFEEYGGRWRVMADPEGNEFCLIYRYGADV
jgi:predicted enzyme related to lactoylglutathione lyase